MGSLAVMGTVPGRTKPGRPSVLAQLPPDKAQRPRLLGADGKTHQHKLYDLLSEHSHVESAIVFRSIGLTGFVPPLKSSAVERTFAWPRRCRRLSAGRTKTHRPASRRSE